MTTTWQPGDPLAQPRGVTTRKPMIQLFDDHYDMDMTFAAAVAETKGEPYPLVCDFPDCPEHRAVVTIEGDS